MMRRRLAVSIVAVDVMPPPGSAVRDGDVLLLAGADARVERFTR
jgi:hypothetical protein